MHNFLDWCLIFEEAIAQFTLFNNKIDTHAKSWHLTAAVPGYSIEVQYSSIQEVMQWSVHAVHTTAAILMQISLPTLGKPNMELLHIYNTKQHSRS